MAETTNVADCSVTRCSYNDHEGCTAQAITVGGGENHASCATFFDIGIHGGLSKAVSHVGACQRTECSHNSHLQCSAPVVHVGPGKDNADCLTYEHVS